MKITRFEIFRYDLPLNRQLPLKNTAETIRSGLIIHLQDDSGHQGLGEIAPLPGLHRESIDDALEQLREVRQFILHKNIPGEVTKLSGGFRRWLPSQLFPSVRFGLETAILFLFAAQEEKPVCKFISPRCRRRVTVNALLDGSRESIRRRLPGIISEGYRAVKIKVGRQSLAHDIALVKLTAQNIPPDISIRLDANRAWELTAAVEFARGIKDVPIEYLEEPLKNPGELAEFHNQTGIPIALDETLAEISPQELEVPRGAAALILKPAVSGGVERTLAFAGVGERHSLKNVISSTFHCGPGFVMEACLAACLNETDVPAGLGTFLWLKQSLLVEPIVIKNGSIDVYRLCSQHPEVRWDLLRRLPPGM